jgi:hypothetical protein
VIAFCTAESNFVLHIKQNKTKIEENRLKNLKLSKRAGKSRHKIWKKAGKCHHKIFEKLSQIFKKAGKSQILSACLCILVHAVAGFRVLVLAFTYLCRL